MKTSRTLLAFALALGSATFSFAGPGPQYWQQRRNPPAPQPKQVASHEHARTTTPADRAELTKDHAGCACRCAKG